MSYAFVQYGQVLDIEARDIPLSQIYHEGALQYFIVIPDGVDVCIGDRYEDGVFTPAEGNRPPLPSLPVTPDQRIAALEALTAEYDSAIVDLAYRTGLLELGVI